MKGKRLSKQQLLEKQIIEDKKFNKYLFISFGLLLLVLILVFVFYTYWHDTQYNFRKFTLYGREVTKKLVCMADNNLKYHESLKVVHENNTYYVCSHDCHQHLINHYQKFAVTQDALSGVTICKSNAIIGLKKRGNPNVVYFENKQNFDNYYKARKKSKSKFIITKINMK